MVNKEQLVYVYDREKKRARCLECNQTMGMQLVYEHYARCHVPALPRKIQEYVKNFEPKNVKVSDFVETNAVISQNQPFVAKDCLHFISINSCHEVEMMAEYIISVSFTNAVNFQCALPILESIQKSPAIAVNVIITKEANRIIYITLASANACISIGVDHEVTPPLRAFFDRLIGKLIYAAEPNTHTALTSSHLTYDFRKWNIITNGPLTLNSMIFKRHMNRTGQVIFQRVRQAPHLNGHETDMPLSHLVNICSKAIIVMYLMSTLVEMDPSNFAKYNMDNFAEEICIGVPFQRPQVGSVPLQITKSKTTIVSSLLDDSDDDNDVIMKPVVRVSGDFWETLRRSYEKALASQVIVKRNDIFTCTVCNDSFETDIECLQHVWNSHT